jgi:hypothetical protein
MHPAGRRPGELIGSLSNPSIALVAYGNWPL